MRTEESLQSREIALDQIVAPLVVDVPDVVEMRVVAMIYLADHPPT